MACECKVVTTAVDMSPRCTGAGRTTDSMYDACVKRIITTDINKHFKMESC